MAGFGSSSSDPCSVDRSQGKLRTRQFDPLLTLPVGREQPVSAVNRTLAHGNQAQLAVDPGDL